MRMKRAKKEANACLILMSLSSCCPLTPLPLAGQALASCCPIFCSPLMSCCNLSATHCAHFPCSSVCLHTAHIQHGTPPPPTNSIVSPCQSPRLRFHLSLSAGMFLQDMCKLHIVVLVTACVTCFFVSVPLVPQAILPPAGPACHPNPVIMRFSGGMAAGHQDGALRR